MFNLLPRGLLVGQIAPPVYNTGPLFRFICLLLAIHKFLGDIYWIEGNKCELEFVI